MFIGIDLGTSEVKVVLMSARGDVVGAHGVKLSIQRPQPMWSEQDPQEWWQATSKAVVELAEKFPNEWRQVEGIGLSGQMHGAVLLDANDEVLRPAILWNDVRSHEECKEITARVKDFHKLAGNLAMPGFTAPKLAWVEKHEPDIFARINSVLLPKDYLRLRMTGEKVSEMSDAAGTLWLDVGERHWSDELLGATHMTSAQMPRLVEGSEVSGHLLPEVAHTWKLPPRCVVAGGGGDNAASAVGIGAVREGDGFISLGTSGVLFVVNNEFRPNVADAVHSFCHALTNRWHQMSVMLSAGSALSWLGRLLAKDEGSLMQNMEQEKTGASDFLTAAPLFLPYLSGERTPHNDPYARGVFFGMNHDSSQAHLVYSVIEGVSFGLYDGLGALTRAGTTIETLSLVGGGARSPFWAQLLADLTQTPMITHLGSETGGALGAAKLGGLAAGLSENELCQRPPIQKIFEPSRDRYDLLFRYENYKKLYQSNRDQFQELNSKT